MLSVMGFYTDKKGRKRPITAAVGKRYIRPKSNSGETLSDLEIMDVLEFMDVPRFRFKVGDRVEVKKGLYKGQIAKVVDIRERPSFLGMGKGPSYEVDIWVWNPVWKHFEVVKGMYPSSLRKVPEG